MNRLPSIRRWGVAALTGVTLFGGLSIVGAGVAGAAVPTVTAAFTTAGQTVTTISGTGSDQVTNDVTLTISGAQNAGDQINLTLACPSTGSADFHTLTVTGTAVAGAAIVSGGGNWKVTSVTNSNCSAGTAASVLLTEGAGGNTTGTTIPLAFALDLSGVSPQSLSISGTYGQVGLAATAFAVPSFANVAWYTVSSNIPAVTLPSPSTTATTAISPITLSMPTTLNGNNSPALQGSLSSGGGATTIVLALPDASESWSLTNAKATASGAVTLAATPLTATGKDLTVSISAVAANLGAQITLSGLGVVTTSATPLGAQNVTVSVNGTATTVTKNLSVGTIMGSITTIAGATPDATVAAEFEAAYSTTGNQNVVLATDAPHTNGSDALAASYLEGQLGTGLLITPSTSLGTDAQTAMQLMGVSTVYVVGGPLAISPAVIAQIEALPAYVKGGIIKTGSNVKVVGPIYGADGTPEGTAAAIATYFGPSNGSVNLSAAYTAGAYNDTTGSQTVVTSAPTTSLSTAFVVASSDWQDAMSLAPLAYNKKLPVILNGASTSTTLSATAQATLTSLGVKQVIVVGGQLALQNSVEAAIEALGIKVLRIAGIDATDTAAQLANFALNTTTNAGLGWAPTAVLASHADYWSDALGAAALGGVNSEPIILVQSPTVIGSYTMAELPKLGVYNLTVLGGPLAMPASTTATLLAGL